MSPSLSANELLAKLAAELPPDTAAAHAQRGLLQLAATNLDAAVSLFATAIQSSPPSGPALDAAAAVLNECALQAPARLAELRTQLLNHPAWSDARDLQRVLANAEVLAGDPTAALVRAGQLLESDPRDGHALRIAVECLDQLNRREEALASVARWIAADSSLEAHAAALKKLDRLLANDPQAKLPAGLTPARVALVGNITLSYLSNAVRVAALSEGVHAQAHTGDFDQFRQELLDPAGALHQFNPDAVIVVLDWREVLPRLYLANLASDPAALHEEIAAEVAQIAQVLRAFREHCAASVLITGPVAPSTSPLGALDATHERSVARLFASLNERLAADVAALPGVYVHQTDRLFSGAGKAACLSPKMNYLGRMPYTPLGMQSLARDFASFVRQAKGKARKCLVLDLDNTMWGGIIGEDGLEGIKLGHDGIGRAFMDFQREALRLHEQGVILAICSKNNEADALEVFQKHPDMVLKLEHFAAWRINWLDKPSNLKSLADEINIGIDSFVFLDDNPIERGAVRQLAPEVLVPELPRDPAEYPDFLRSLTCFATLQLTDEDLKRGQFYAGERQRKTLQESAGNLDDYLKALGMVLHITPIDEFTRPRIVQLIHRTNQFNLTTRRHTEIDVRNMTVDTGHHIFSIRLEDRYGDNGIVGVAILRLHDGDPAFPGQRVGLLDTLLMSCRILGRNVEKMFLAHLTDFAADRGAQLVVGEYIKSAKNQMVADFYPRFGFDPLPPLEDVQRWSLPVLQRRIERPPYITVSEHQNPPRQAGG